MSQLPAADYEILHLYVHDTFLQAVLIATGKFYLPLNYKFTLVSFRCWIHELKLDRSITDYMDPRHDVEFLNNIKITPEQHYILQFGTDTPELQKIKELLKIN